MGLGCQILDIHIHSAAKQGNVPAHSGKPAPLGGSFLDHKNKDKKKPDLRCFMIDKGKISEYERVFEHNGFSADEIHQIVANLINIVAKNPDDVLKTLNELKIFEVSDKDYRNFVLENTFYLFRAFSENLNVCFSELIEKCGDKEKAFEELCKHPEIMTEYEDL